MKKYSVVHKRSENACSTEISLLRNLCCSPTVKQHFYNRDKKILKSLFFDKQIVTFIQHRTTGEQHRPTEMSPSNRDWVSSGVFVNEGVQPIMDIIRVKVQLWRNQTIFLHEFLFIIKLHHCLQHHEKEIEIQVDENEEEAFEKMPSFDLLWTYPITLVLRNKFFLAMFLKKSSISASNVSLMFLRISSSQAFWGPLKIRITRFQLYILKFC